MTDGEKLEEIFSKVAKRGLENNQATGVAQEEPATEQNEPIQEEQTNEEELQSENEEVGEDSTASTDGESPENIQDGETSEGDGEESEQLDLDNIEDWDSEEGTESSEEGPSETKIDYSEVAKSFGIENANSIDEIKAGIEEQISKAKEEALASLPEELKIAAELAKEGYDPVAAINQATTDYSKINDIDLVAGSLEAHFTDKEGKLNTEDLNAYLDGMSDQQVKIEASKIRSTLEAQDKQAKLALQQKMESRKKQAEQGIESALKDFDNVNGFKVKPYQKQKIKESIVNDTLAQDLFFTKGQVDYSKAAKVKFIVDNFDKITSYLKNQARNSTKREVLEQASNPEVRTSSKPAEVTPKSGNPMKDVQKAWIESLKGN